MREVPLYTDSDLAENHSPSRQEQLVDFKTSNLPLADCLRQCLSIYSTNLYEGVEIPDLQINRFARILRAGGREEGGRSDGDSPTGLAVPDNRGRVRPRRGRQVAPPAKCASAYPRRLHRG